MTTNRTLNAMARTRDIIAALALLTPFLILWTEGVLPLAIAGKVAALATATFIGLLLLALSLTHVLWTVAPRKTS